MIWLVCHPKSVGNEKFIEVRSVGARVRGKRRVPAKCPFLAHMTFVQVPGRLPLPKRGILRRISFSPLVTVENSILTLTDIACMHTLTRFTQK